MFALIMIIAAVLVIAAVVTFAKAWKAFDYTDSTAALVLMIASIVVFILTAVAVPIALIVL